MKFVPSLPPLTGISETDEVKPLLDTRAVHPVRERLNAPLIKRRARQQNTGAREIHWGEASQQTERRERTDRREVCRRLYLSLALMDTRALRERRRGNRRLRDAITNVDEIA